MRLLALGIVMVIVGIILPVIAAMYAVETQSLFGLTVKTPNPYLLYSGLGLTLVGVLLIILGIATSKKPIETAAEIPREVAQVGAEKEVDVVKILKKSFGSIVAEPSFILLYLPPFAIILILFAYILVVLGTLTHWAAISTYTQLISIIGELLPILVVSIVSFLILYLCATATIILKSGSRERGEWMSAGEALVGGMRVFPKLFVATILAGAIIFGPFLLPIAITIFAPSPITVAVAVVFLVVWLIPMIYIACRLSFWAQACVLDDLGPVGCLKESWRVTKGNFWLIFVTGFLLIIPYLLLSQIPPVGFIIGMLVISPIPIIAFTLLYLGIKKTNEPQQDPDVA